MASIIKSNTYADFNGREILTANNNGALTTQKILYPAFFAELSANQSVSDNVYTKAECNTEVLDTDNCYDNTTNYRFTPNVAGKYFVYGQVTGDTSNSNLADFDSALYKNGSIVQRSFNIPANNYGATASQSIQSIVDMNGTTDYLELFGRVNVVSGTTIVFFGSVQQTCFGAYRIGS